MNGWSNADISNLFMLLRQMNENLNKIRETQVRIESHLRPVLSGQEIVDAWKSLGASNTTDTVDATRAKVQSTFTGEGDRVAG